MPRVAPIDMDRLTDEQKQVAARIVSGPRGEVRGPFRVLMHSPKLADCVQATGAYVRYAAAVPWKLRELAILMTARHWNAQYEWYAHEKEAQKAELDQGIIDAIRNRRTPSFTDEAEREVWQFCQELYADKRVSAETFRKVVDRHGEQGAIDLAGLIGHYNLIAITLNVFDVETPADAVPLAE
ncbi:MAG: carboxymuconolactone decarboxylase family protein [Alphaproteobacteria bacterium]|nr:carboxymuconolactone decarboxylase family protein [Alphaproteobacteria bacterium]